MVKQQKKKSRPSWFQKQIERGGEDFLLRKSPTDIQKEAFNIVRDISRGNITKRDFPYLFDLKVLSNARIAVYEKYVETHVYDSSISYVLQMQGGVQFLERSYGVSQENLQKVFNNTRTLLTVYLVILQTLDAAIAFVQTDYQKSEEDYMSVYSTMCNQLSRFRYYI